VESEELRVLQGGLQRLGAKPNWLDLGSQHFLHAPSLKDCGTVSQLVRNRLFIASTSSLTLLLCGTLFITRTDFLAFEVLVLDLQSFGKGVRGKCWKQN